MYANKNTSSNDTNLGDHLEKEHGELSQPVFKTTKATLKSGGGVTKIKAILRYHGQEKQ